MHPGQWDSIKAWAEVFGISLACHKFFVKSVVDGRIVFLVIERALS